MPYIPEPGSTDVISITARNAKGASLHLGPTAPDGTQTNQTFVTSLSDSVAFMATVKSGWAYHEPTEGYRRNRIHSFTFDHVTAGSETSVRTPARDAYAQRVLERDGAPRVFTRYTDACAHAVQRSAPAEDVPTASGSAEGAATALGFTFTDAGMRFAWHHTACGGSSGHVFLTTALAAGAAMKGHTCAA